MSLTMQDVINDAKTLCSRLKGHDSTVDSVLSQLQTVYQQAETMKDYDEEIGKLNDMAAERPRMALVAGIQQENKHIMELQQENRELRIALEEQQNAIDLIMTKYRQHISKLMRCQQFDQKLLKTISNNSKVLENNTKDINEMKHVVRAAIDMDETSIIKEEELISRLWTENKGLRELLNISAQFGSYKTIGLPENSKDAEIQTDSDLGDSEVSAKQNKTTD